MLKNHDPKVLAMTNGYAPGVLKNDFPDPYNFRLYPTNLEFGPPLIKWLKENRPEIKKVGIARAQRRGRPGGHQRRSPRTIASRASRPWSSSSSAAPRSSRR